ncbi:MAG: hypothetical protein SFX72_12935 [Isosphaeraceae bacterium]|nr:hypothetical protein [Isosphaeraceae bacterium]
MENSVPECVSPNHDEPRRPTMTLVALALFGGLLGAWPNLVNLAATGRARFLADSDALLYHAWSRDALLTPSWSLTDGVHEPSGPAMHPWLLFVPPAKVARVLGIDVDLVWRTLAGAGLALGLFAVIRRFTASIRVAAAVSAALLCEGGLILGLPLVHTVQSVGSILLGSGEVLASVPRLFPHLRVPTPALPLALLLVHISTVISARASSRSRAIVPAALSFAALFYAYFYFWTAAGLALLLAIGFDRRGAGRYLRIAFFGGLLGSPAIVQGWLAKRSTPPDWLLRTEKFLPIGRFEDLLVPKFLIAVWLVSSVIVLTKRRSLIHLWCLVLAGILCADHQLITGLQIENFHWVYAFGTAFSLLLVGVLLPLLQEWWGKSGVWSRRAAMVSLGCILGAGVVLRTVETVSSRESRWVAGIAERWERSIPELPAGAVVAGDPDDLAFAAATSLVRPLFARLVEYSASADDRELDERLVLNWFLLGTARDRALEQARAPAGHWSREAAAMRDSETARRQELRRKELVQAIWDEPTAFLERYRVEFLALPRGASPPAIPGRSWSSINTENVPIRLFRSR